MATSGENSAEQVLRALASPGREPIDVPVAVVVAHPDDETIGCGAQLGRFTDLTIIHVTDGAPRDLADARARGFETAEAYAAARREELATAIAMAGVPGDTLVGLGWPDQRASLHLAEITAALRAHLADKKVVLTHAYEGGHPDHDATAFAVHASGALVRPKGGNPPIILEMPLYHAGADGWRGQVFVPAEGCPETEIRLTAAEEELKSRMLAAHRSQRDAVAGFQTGSERFRAAPDYDFAALPNGGRLNYQDHEWGMTGDRWLDLVAVARRELGLEEPR